MTRSLQSRVLALAGLGVFAASAALTLLSRDSLLSIEESARREQARTVTFGVREIPRDAAADRAALQVLAETVEREVAGFRRRSLWIAPALTGVALLLAWGIVQSVRRPVQTLTDAAERIASGDLSRPIAGDEDEIGRLGAALERMRAELQRSIAAVERANAILEQRVQERTAQLSRVLRAVISAQEDERRRVARELHDETSQLVAAMAMELHAAGDAPSRTRLAKLAMLVDRMHDGLHRIIVNLRPSILDDLGLGPAIEWLAEHQLRHAGIAARSELGELQECRADAAIEIALFRIVQESITNIVRHARASTVLIQGGMTASTDAPGRIWIEIEDDGVGFEPLEPAADTETLRGVGLLGMRERVELIGGRLELESSPGAGTRVRVEAPMRLGESVAA